jgi:hypothetical protein
MVVVVWAMAPVDGEGTSVPVDEGLGVGIGAAGGEGFGGFLSVAGGLLFFELADAGVVAFAHCFGVGFLLLHFFFGEPAGGRIVGVAGGFGLAEALALLLIAVFGEGPLGFMGAGRALVFFIGADGFAVGAGEDFDDGFGDAGGLLGGGGADGEGAGQRLGDDLAGVGDGTGGTVIDLAGQEALGDLGEEELDGGVVLEKGEDDFLTFWGELGVAVELVLVAVDAANEGVLVALMTVDAEGAAAAFGLGLRRNRGPGGVGSWFRHCQSFRAWRMEHGAWSSQVTGCRAQVAGRSGPIHGPACSKNRSNNRKAPPGR